MIEMVRIWVFNNFPWIDKKKNIIKYVKKFVMRKLLVLFDLT
jgi:hypothetical protein